MPYFAIWMILVEQCSFIRFLDKTVYESRCWLHCLNMFTVDVEIDRSLSATDQGMWRCDKCWRRRRESSSKDHPVNRNHYVESTVRQSSDSAHECAGPPLSITSPQTDFVPYETVVFDNQMPRNIPRDENDNDTTLIENTLYAPSGARPVQQGHNESPENISSLNCEVDAPNDLTLIDNDLYK